MTYQLKSTTPFSGADSGVIVRHCIAVDPDTSEVKDFASAGVTADLTVGANVTIASQTWKSVSRPYFQLGSGTAADDYIAFGATKPVWDFNSGESRTLVVIGEAGSGPILRIFGANSGAYFSTQNGTTGGSTFPNLTLGGTATGTGGPLTSGQKFIGGFSVVHNTSSTAYRALEGDTTITSESATTLNPGGTTFDFNPAYIGRRNDSATSALSYKIHAVLILEGALSSTGWQALLDDWFGTLLEVAGGGGGGVPIKAFRIIHG